MATIFITYRRDDASGEAGRLAENLKQRFPKARIFLDVDSIEIGQDFSEEIKKYVGISDVQLVLIGRDWLGDQGAGSTPRLHEQNDFVRLEVAAALERKIRVVPLLVGGAAMPRPEKLPADLQDITRRQAFELRHARWSDDVGRLMDALETILDKTKSRTNLPPQERMPAGHAPASSRKKYVLLAIGAVAVLVAIFVTLSNSSKMNARDAAVEMAESAPAAEATPAEAPTQ